MYRLEAIAILSTTLDATIPAQSKLSCILSCSKPSLHHPVNQKLEQGQLHDEKYRTI